MRQSIVSFIVGIIFAFGLVISGMTNPTKVLAFLDLSGKWDPSLAFVMVGAIGVYFLSYKWITKRDTPILEKEFSLPMKKGLDQKLIIGAVLFGLGWGIAGFCPGPAIVNLSSLNPSALIFFVAMTLGAGIYQIQILQNKDV